MTKSRKFGKRVIRKPEDHDWTGCRCTFRVQLVAGAVVVDPATGYLRPGTTKAKGTVVGQRYLGPAGVGMIPDFAVDVACKTGTYTINLLDNGFEVVD